MSPIRANCILSAPISLFSISLLNIILFNLSPFNLSSASVNLGHKFTTIIPQG